VPLTHSPPARSKSRSAKRSRRSAPGTPMPLQEHPTSWVQCENCGAVELCSQFSDRPDAPFGFCLASGNACVHEGDLVCGGLLVEVPEPVPGAPSPWLPRRGAPGTPGPSFGQPVRGAPGSPGFVACSPSINLVVAGQTAAEPIPDDELTDELAATVASTLLASPASQLADDESEPLHLCALNVHI
jgi:hypothetical protein